VYNQAANRRSTAAAAWAVQNGVLIRTYRGDGSHSHTDWSALRAAGLCQ
jgi:hypothetical protein